MPLHLRKVYRRTITVSAWTACLIVAHPIIGLVQFAPAQDHPPAQTLDETFNDMTGKTAAARLLPAMGSNTPIDTKVARLIDRLVLRDKCQWTRILTQLVNPNCYAACGSHGGAVSSRTALILSFFPGLSSSVRGPVGPPSRPRATIARTSNGTSSRVLDARFPPRPRSVEPAHSNPCLSPPTS
jgi:hypothetical protein